MIFSRSLIGILSLAIWMVPNHVGAKTTNAEQLERLAASHVDEYKTGGRSGERSDYSAASFMHDIEMKQETLGQLEAIDPKGLTLEQDIDRRLLIGITRSDINTELKQRRWENDAAMYLKSARLGQLFEPAFAGTQEQRIEQLTQFLEAMPLRLSQGRQNLKRPPKRFTDAAIFQARNSLETLKDGRKDLPELDSETALIYDRAVAALGDYLAFLEGELAARSDGDWALGREAYDFILKERWYMDTNADDILRRGHEAFADTEALAQEVAARIEPGKHWTEVFETLKEDHPTAAGLKQAYQQQMDAARVFVLEHQILTLPEGERVITIDTPPAMRRSSPFGTFQQADPFDGGLEGRLILTPIEDWMTAEEQARRLRSHLNPWIPVIAVHEAYPGHHAQALKVNENPNLLRRVVGEPIFSEGWGLFTEELMYELGFLTGDAVRLTQLRNRIWRAARVILDVSLHTGKMTFDEAVDFLVEKARFERYAAELEVGMYVRRPTYVLGYLIGMQEIEAIRAEYIRLKGEPEPPSEFYDRLLYIGSIPPSLLREELLAGKDS